jgi:hypothetical protein
MKIRVTKKAELDSSKLIGFTRVSRRDWETVLESLF